MLRSSNDGGAVRHTAPQPDDNGDANPRIPRMNQEAADGLETTPSQLRPSPEPVQDSAKTRNSLQESAYRLHALVKRNNPQRLAASPIRYNKTAPLPKLDIHQTLHPPRPAGDGHATGGVGKAPPSPRRSPLRRHNATDMLTGTPQTRNVVERMIAYARHAASQEDPTQVQQDRQRFVTRIADQVNDKGILKESPVLGSSPKFPSHSGGGFPIMSNLSMHANLKQQQQKQQQAVPHTAPLTRRFHDSDSIRPAQQAVGVNAPSGAAAPSSDALSHEHEAVQRWRRHQPVNTRSQEIWSQETRSQERKVLPGDEHLAAESLSAGLEKPLTADHTAEPRGDHAEPQRARDRSNGVADGAPSAPAPRNGSSLAPAGARPSESSHFAAGQHAAAPSTPPQKDRVNLRPFTPLDMPRSTERTPQHVLGKTPLQESSQWQQHQQHHQQHHQQQQQQHQSPAQLPPQPELPSEAPQSANLTIDSTGPWSKEKWLLFSKAMHESFAANNLVARDALHIFNDLIIRLPPDMRTMSIQDMVHRLNAWVRSTSRLTRD